MPHNSVIPLFLALAIIIAAAKAAGYLTQLIGQPAVLGGLLAGILLGPTVVNMLGWPVLHVEYVAETIHHTAELGVLLLMFNAGLEVDLKSLRSVGHAATYSGLLGVLVPVATILPLTLVMTTAPMAGALAISVAMAATSVSISAQTMLELGVLQRKEGITLLGAAVIDDVLVILLLSLLIGISVTGSGLSEIALLLVRMGLFMVGAVAVSMLLLPRLAHIIHDLPISRGVLALAVASALFFGWGADMLGGVAAITGAFIAGVGFSRSGETIKYQIEQGMHSLNYGLLVPIFLVNIGLTTNLRVLTGSYIPFTAALLVVAVLSKLVGSGLGARLGGFDNRSALRVGIGMVSRGEVGLIVASVAQNHNLIPPEMFSSIVLVIIVSTLLTPPMVRWAFRQRDEVANVAGTKVSEGESV